MAMFHQGSRTLQDRYGGRALADKLVETREHSTFTEDEIAFISAAPFFFLATASADGNPDCSFKGGDPGFVRVTGPAELAFPDYDGNSMFMSLGNILVNPQVGMLFIDMREGRQRRIRVKGRARVADDDPLLAEFLGAVTVVRVAAEHIFPNCPRYIPGFAEMAPSPYVPRQGTPDLEPEWKSREVLKGTIPPRRR